MDALGVHHVGKFLELENWKGVHLLKEMQISRALLPVMPRKGPPRKAVCGVLWK